MINSYTYDNLNRPILEVKNGLSTSFQYDMYSRVINETYPGGFGINKLYNSYGYLTQIKRADNGASIWQANEMNSFGQYTTYTLGNGVQTQKTYTPEDYLTNIVAGGGLTQNLALSYDYTNGNLLSRTDGILGLTENFTYTDHMNRLTEASSTNADVTVSYDAVGDIIAKSDVCAPPSTYTDGGNNQCVNVPNNSINAITPGQSVTYNSFNAPVTIQLGNYSIAYTYGPDNNRVLTTLTDPYSNITNRYFDEDYEKSILNGTNTTEVNYINCGGNLAAMYVTQNGVGTMYYTYTDHLGSILKVTDASGNPVAQQSFDAWGNYRSPVDWSYNSIPTQPNWLYRGFTGHEHLPEFQLINMNARLYDPFEGNFLSPDEALQQPDNTQNYNKYAYCLNNPLKYSDQNGQFFELIIGAILGGFEGYEIGHSNGAHGWGLFGDILAGAGIGAATSGIADAYSLAGASAVATGSIGGFISGVSFSVLAGGGNNPASSPLLSGIIGAASGGLGSLAGASIAGGGGAFVGGAIGSGANATLSEAISPTGVNFGNVNFGNVGESTLMGGVTSWGAYYASSYLNYEFGGGKNWGHIEIESFDQFLTLQKDFQLSRFYGKEYGGLLCDDGSVSDWSGTSSGVDIPDDPDAYAQFHTHWDEPGIMRYTLTTNGDYINGENYPVGTQVHAIGGLTTQYIDSQDENTSMQEIILNRYDGTYYPGIQNGCQYNWYPINPPIERFVWSFMFAQ